MNASPTGDAVRWPQDFPAIGTRVVLRHWTEGNVYAKSHDNSDQSLRGTVTETPRRGSIYLCLDLDKNGATPALPERAQYDKQDPEAWSMSPSSAAIHQKEFWRWTIEVLPPLEPQVIEVGDRVTYAPDEEGETQIAWMRRKGRTYTVVSAFDNGSLHGLEYRMIEVVPVRNRHNPDEPDEFFARAKSLRMVAKAEYTPVP